MIKLGLGLLIIFGGLILIALTGRFLFTKLTGSKFDNSDGMDWVVSLTLGLVLTAIITLLGMFGYIIGNAIIG